ncbi:MAG: outer membrane beta-barrel protein, partial [Pseudomonadota bacterium]
LASAPPMARAADLGEPPPGSIKDDFAPTVSPQLRYYGSIQGAFVFAEDTDFDFGTANVINTYEDLGYSVSASLGTEIWETSSYVLRGDIELGYRSAAVESHIIGGVDQAGSTGDTDVFFGLANLTMDFKTGTPFRPYLSAGGGFGHVDLNGHSTTATGLAMDDSATGYSFQVGAGFSYALSETTSLTAGYRYFNVIDVDLTATDGTESSVDVEDHQILLGLRQRF